VLSLGSALAPVALGPVRTILTGVLAIALTLALAAFDGLWFSAHAAVALAAIAGVTASGVIASSAPQGRERELVNVRAVADVAQRVLLNQLPRRMGRARRLYQPTWPAAGPSILSAHCRRTGRYSGRPAVDRSASMALSRLGTCAASEP